MAGRFVSVWILRLAVPLFLLIAIFKIQGFLSDFVGEQRQLRELNFDFYQAVVLQESYHQGQYQGSGFLRDKKGVASLKGSVAKGMSRFDHHGHFHPVVGEEQILSWRKLSTGCLQTGACATLENQLWSEFFDNGEQHDSPEVDLLEHLQWLGEQLSEALYFDRIQLAEASSEGSSEEINWELPVFIGSGHFAETWQRELFDELSLSGTEFEHLSIAQLPQVAQLSTYPVAALAYQGRFVKDVFSIDQFTLLSNEKEVRKRSQEQLTPTKMPVLVAGRKKDLLGLRETKSFGFQHKHFLSALDIEAQGETFYPATICTVSITDLVCDRHLASQVLVLSGDVAVDDQALAKQIISKLHQARRDGASSYIWDLSIGPNYPLLKEIVDWLQPNESLVLTRAWRELAMVPWELFNLLEQAPSLRLLLDPGHDFLASQRLFMALTYFSVDWTEWVHANGDRVVAAVWYEPNSLTSYAYLRHAAELVYQWLYSEEFSLSLFHQRGYNKWHEPGLYLQSVSGMGLALGSLEVALVK